MTATISDTSGGLCSGSTFEVKESSTQKCSGILSGLSGSCSFSQSASSSHTYSLYIPIGSGVPMDTKTANCGTPPVTGCSAYNGNGGNCNNAGGCYYCAIYGTCLATGDTSCPGYVDCSSYTSQSACNWDGGTSSAKPACGWCPNSYNGGTSANGGICYSASVLASKCGGCYATGTYNTWSPSYCRDACPYAAPTNGYSSGWCAMGNVLSTGNENCGGNKFDVSKSSNGVVDCGECAINANGQDCGGTAVNGNMIYNGETYVGNEAADVYGGSSVAPYGATRYDWCGRGICTTSGGYTVRCSTHYQNWGFHCPSSLIDHPNSGEILCGSGGLSASCEAGCGGYYAVNTCNAGDTCVASGDYYGGGKCCPAGYPYYNSADGKCYSQHGALGCADKVDNDRNCLIDCDDSACSNGGSGSIIYNADGTTTTVCAGSAAKQACGGPCGSCPGGQNCVSGVCQPACVPTTCVSLGYSCGSAPDGCGGTLNCGSCSIGYSCSSGVCQDTTPPSTSISLNPASPNGINGWYVSHVTASIICNDVGSGCQKISYTTDNGAHWYSASALSTLFTYVLNFGDGTYAVQAYSTDNAGNAGAKTSIYQILADTAAPSVSVTGAPSGWTGGSATASASCSDYLSGCAGGTYRLKTYSASPGSCSNNYADYSLASPSTISSHVWVCGAAKDIAGNAGFSSPVEFKVDEMPPQVRPYGIPFAPCTLDPAAGWIDCSATASLDTSGLKGCQDADSGCNPASYGFIKYYSNPGICPASKSSYSGKAPQLDNITWVCGYAEDNVGNAAVSSPVKFMVNRTFVIVVNAKAYGDIDVPAGTEVKGYLCDPSQYYCNHDSKYLAAASGVVGADKWFSIAFVRELARGTEYKVGLQTEKGYAETEFIA